MRGQFLFCVERSGIFHGFTAWSTVHFESMEAEGSAVELDTGPSAEWNRFSLCCAFRIVGCILDILTCHSADLKGVLRSRQSCVFPRSSTLLHCDANSTHYHVLTREVPPLHVLRSPLMGHLMELSSHFCKKYPKLIPEQKIKISLLKLLKIKNTKILYHPSLVIHLKVSDINISAFSLLSKCTLCNLSV